MDKIKVLILCGGLGTRLSDVLKGVPKPMAPINGKPFLYYQVELLKKYGFSDFCFLTGHMSDQISDYFKDGADHGINCTYSVEDTPLGTGGAVSVAISNCEDQVEGYLVLNGDTFFDIDYRAFCEIACNNFSIALLPVEESARYGSVELDESNNVLSFNEKNSSKGKSLINSGVYFISTKSRSYLLEGAYSLEKDLFPELTEKKQLSSQVLDGFFIDIGIPTDYKRAQIMVPAALRKRSSLS